MSGLAKISLVVVILSFSATSVRAQSIDRVQRSSGIDSGSITGVTPLGVTISRGGVESKIPVEEIESIQFADEPPELNSVRTQYRRGRYDKAVDRLQKIDRTKITRTEVLQDLDFYTTACNANLALAGKGDLKKSIAEIGAFLSGQRTSYHVPAAIELHGELYLATGDTDLARKKFETLAKAPSPYYKSRSALLVAQLLQEQGNHNDALAQFELSLLAAGTNTLANDMKNEATLGRAVSLAATEKVGEGITVIRQVIQQTPPNDTEALAQGYNALGDCLLAAGDKRGAREAFLHVDLLFNVSATEHAKALARLTDLWKTMRQPSRAQDAQQRLSDEYPLSGWTAR